MLNPDFDQVEALRIEKAVKRVGQRFGLVLVPSSLSTAVNQIGARAVIEIDPVTGLLIEQRPSTGLLYPGMYPGQHDKSFE